MQPEKKTIRTKSGPKEYTCLGCPLTRNRTAWCFRLCAPDGEGNGRCGRVAPHGLRGRTQLSIEQHGKKLLEAHCQKLERWYLSAPSSEYYDPGVRISEGEAEIIVALREKFLRAPGAVHASVGFATMVDAALLAVNSIVENALVVEEHFEIRLTRPRVTGEIVARSRFLGMSGEHYLAESVLIGANDEELGRGSGTFSASEIPLSPDIGYK